MILTLLIFPILSYLPSFSTIHSFSGSSLFDTACLSACASQTFATTYRSTFDLLTRENSHSGVTAFVPLQVITRTNIRSAGLMDDWPPEYAPMG
ncbi:hypothetical protein DENSPDRAFT_345924 [Dentipellis sp. KUC8613]|nr:hypothetical protein DENSPDRAFT_345924 [Dentipellis sp. KUC8613]